MTVTYDPELGSDIVPRLAALLPPLVSEALSCPEEPYDGNLKSGDIVLTFVRRGPADLGGVACLVKVETKRYESRVANLQERTDMITERVVSEIGNRDVGIWVTLQEGAWSQGSDLEESGAARDGRA